MSRAFRGFRAAVTIQAAVALAVTLAIWAPHALACAALAALAIAYHRCRSEKSTRVDDKSA